MLHGNFNIVRNCRLLSKMATTFCVATSNVWVSSFSASLSVLIIQCNYYCCCCYIAIAMGVRTLYHWKKKREGCCHFTWSTSSYVHQAENNQFLNCFSSLLAIWLRKEYVYMLTTYDVKLFQFLGIQQGTKGSLCTHSKFSIWAAEVSTKSRYSESAGKRGRNTVKQMGAWHVGALCTYVCTPVYPST